MKKYILQSLLVALPFFSSCSDEAEDPQMEAGDTPIELLAGLTRAGEPARSDIYVRAYKEESNNLYFSETRASIPSGLSETDPQTIVFSGAKPYYPFGQATIRIMAHSGKAPNGVMPLTAGTTLANDAILSNYGKSQSDTDVNEDYAPRGTIGTSVNPVEILQFRHVMTQVIVSVVLDDASQVDQEPKTLHFTLPDNVAVTTGKYNIQSRSLDLATEPSAANYSIKLGTNYLVPNGVNLVDKTMTSLVIDDYTAKPEDLTEYKIAKAAGTLGEMQLLPGYSYRLTLKISRLKLTGITLEKIDWEPHDVTGDLTYVPNRLALNLGSYNTGVNYDVNDTISRVVLLATDGKQYVGRSVGGDMQFITLPDAGTVSEVYLYTNRGRLLGSNINSGQYTKTDLNIPLSVGGFLQAGIPSDPYQITTTVQFMNVRHDLTANYKQMATVDLNTLNLIDDDRLFNGFEDTFTGTFDGNGYRIDGIDIASRGLFDTNAGTLKNIRLTTGTIDATGKDYAGSIAGVNSGNIIACVNEARITNIARAMTIQGGIVGQNTATGRVIGNVNTGTILLGDVMGGIVGENSNINANAIVACINTGMLNPNAIGLGYIIGQQTIDTANDVINTSFGLVGSAQHVVGAPEYAVGGNNAGTLDTSVLEPAILRNGLGDGMTEADRVVTRLNNALGLITDIPDVAAYKYVYDDPNKVTGISWPAPVLK